MHTKSVMRSAVAAGLALLVVSTLRADELRWKFKQGETLNYVLERGIEGKLTLSGAEIQFTMQMIFDTSWKPAAVAGDGTANMDLTVDRIQVNMNSPLFGRMAYDSKSSKEPEGPVWAQMKPVMGGMLGETFKAKISPLGQMSDIELPKKLSDALASQQVGENRRQGFGIGSSGFDEKGIKELLVKSVLVLPEAKDATWTQSFENKIPMIGTQISETTFSVAGTEKLDGKDLAKISAETELAFEPIENPRADLEIMSQEASATYYFDPQAGHMVKANGVQKAEMEVSGPQEVTQNITETMSMHLGKSPDKPAAEDAPDKK
ncbi:MAG: DUF6263 family protein [Pirellulales bacterium]